MIRLKKGQGLIEFALILPFIIILVVGVFDFGRIMLAYSTLNTAVREGTRMAIVGSSKNDVVNRISAIAETNLPGFTTGDITCVPVTCTTPALKINISIKYLFDPITPVIPDFYINVQSEMSVPPYYSSP